MEFQLRKAQRKQSRMKLGIQGPSGSGKTYSSLLLAYGLIEDWSKVAVIDTENHSSELYSHLGGYNVLTLKEPFSPERYIEAIETCEKAGMEVIIIDSISHEWEGNGGILEVHSKMTGNSFTNWHKVTPRHNAFVQKILQSSAHIIATIRSKQSFVLSEKNGKLKSMLLSVNRLNLSSRSRMARCRASEGFGIGSPVRDVTQALRRFPRMPAPAHRVPGRRK